MTGGGAVVAMTGARGLGGGAVVGAVVAMTGAHR